MTNKECIDHILVNGVNGCYEIEETGQEEVIVGHTDLVPATYDSVGIMISPEVPPQPIKEIHTFKYSALIVRREDITVRLKELDAQRAQIQALTN